MTRLERRLGNQDGTALIIALMSMVLLTALAAAVVMVSSTEVKIAGNYNNAQETLYAADAAVERVVQDLLLTPRWNDILGGTVQSALIDGSSSTQKMVAGSRILLCCGTNSATGQLQAATDARNLWGVNNPQWKLFAYAPLNDMLPDVEMDSPSYIAVWVADDPAETDSDPTKDTNGTLTIHAEAFGPTGTHKVVEVTVARTSGTEIERGQIAQRGQEELNQRSRKAAVQTPGKALGNMKMNTSSGGLVGK